MEKDNKNSTFNSAILTACLETLNTLKEVKAEQKRIGERLDQLQDTADEHGAEIDKLLSLQHPDDIVEMRRTIKAIEVSIDSMDFTRFTKEQENQLNNVKKFLSTHMDSINASLHSDIESSNNAANLKAMKQLVLGLQSMDSNTKLVATRMDKVSNYLNKIQEATKELSGTIMDSNSRVISMDTRMSSMYNIGNEEDIDTTGDAITVLQRFIDHTKGQDEEFKQLKAKNDAADKLNAIVGDKFDKYRKPVVEEAVDDDEDDFFKADPTDKLDADAEEIKHEKSVESEYVKPDLDVEVQDVDPDVDIDNFDTSAFETNELPEDDAPVEEPDENVETHETTEDLGAIQDAIRDLHSDEPRKE